MVQAFVHIGFPKSGSSSIQRLLWVNRDTLCRQGVQAFMGLNGLIQLQDGDSLSLDVDPAARKLVFSDERLSSRITGPEQVGRIIDIIGRHADDIRIIAYVRRADEMLLSSYITMLTSVGAKRRLGEVALQPRTYPRRQILHWETIVGRDRMIVRRFGDCYLPNGLISDFCDVLGLDPTTLVLPPRVNATPLMDVVELIRVINVTRPAWSDGRLRLKELMQVQGMGPPIGMARDRRMAVTGLAAEDEAELAQAYFGTDRLFDHPYPDDEPPVQKLKPRDVTRLIDELGRMKGLEFPHRPMTDTADAARWARDCLLQMDLK